MLDNPNLFLTFNRILFITLILLSKSELPFLTVILKLDKIVGIVKYF